MELSLVKVEFNLIRSVKDFDNQLERGCSEERASKSEATAKGPDAASGRSHDPRTI